MQQLFARLEAAGVPRARAVALSQALRVAALEGWVGSLPGETESAPRRRVAQAAGSAAGIRV